jgi:uncharacterized protein
MPPLLRRVRVIAARLLLVIAALYLGFVLMFAAFQRSLIYHPNTQRAAAGGPPTAQSARGLERHAIQSPQGEVEAWLIPGEGVSAARPGPVVIFAHGNAELIDDWPSALSPYLAVGVSVWLQEYRGYGRSAGAPSQAAITTDFAAGYDLLAAHPLVNRDKILFHGRSLGGGVVMSLTTLRRPAAIILESTFTSLAAVAQGMGVPAFIARRLLCDPFESEAALRRYDGPVLIFHGDRDTLIPPTQGQRLHLAAPQSTFISQPCGHNDFPCDHGAYWQALRSFLLAAHITSSSP